MKRSEFSLVELIVVILAGSLVLGAALLAGEKGGAGNNLVGCQNNLKMIGMAQMSYAGMNGDDLAAHMIGEKNRSMAFRKAHLTPADRTASVLNQLYDGSFLGNEALAKPDVSGELAKIACCPADRSHWNADAGYASYVFFAYGNTDWSSGKMIAVPDAVPLAKNGTAKRTRVKVGRDDPGCIITSDCPGGAAYDGGGTTRSNHPEQINLLALGGQVMCEAMDTEIIAAFQKECRRIADQFDADGPYEIK